MWTDPRRIGAYALMALAIVVVLVMLFGRETVGRWGEGLYRDRLAPAPPHRPILLPGEQIKITVYPPTEETI